MNTALLQHPEVKDMVTRIWSEERCESRIFFTRLRKFLRYYKSFCKTQADVNKRKESKVRQALAGAQELLQSSPLDAVAQQQVARS
jgi:hypothetical protein